MRVLVVVILVLSAALVFRMSREGPAHAPTFADLAVEQGFGVVDRRALTAGGSYSAVHMVRETDRCEVVAIPIEDPGEFWSVVPGLLGGPAWQDGRLWDTDLQPLPSSAARFLIHRYERRLRGQPVATVAAAVFGSDACLAEWDTGIAD